MAVWGPLHVQSDRRPSIGFERFGVRSKRRGPSFPRFIRFYGLFFSLACFSIIPSGSFYVAASGRTLPISPNIAWRSDSQWQKPPKRNPLRRLRSSIRSPRRPNSRRKTLPPSWMPLRIRFERRLAAVDRACLQFRGSSRSRRRKYRRGRLSRIGKIRLPAKFRPVPRSRRRRRSRSER